jgi:hypothetical protein
VQHLESIAGLIESHYPVPVDKPAVAVEAPIQNHARCKHHTALAIRGLADPRKSKDADSSDQPTGKKLVLLVSFGKRSTKSASQIPSVNVSQRTEFS